MGQISAPFMKFELNSPEDAAVPWLRSIDGFHSHDDAFGLAIAGGVTTVQILPGSGNAIGIRAVMAANCGIAHSLSFVQAVKPSW